jgi:transketolase C-terminal domain/subunit
MFAVKPLDTEAVLQAARETAGIVTAEEATIAGMLDDEAWLRRSCSTIRSK